MNFSEPWFKVTIPDNAVDELKRETCPGHPLYGISVKVVARRQDCDDVLFELCDGSGRYAAVHLSYQEEKDPRWPECHLYRDFEDWVQNCMKQDHSEWI